MELKKVLYMYRDKAEMRNFKNPTPLQNNAGPISGLQCNALPSLVRFVTYTTKLTRDASALHWRPKMGPPSFNTLYVAFLSFLIPGLFLSF